MKSSFTIDLKYFSQLHTMLFFYLILSLSCTTSANSNFSSRHHSCKKSLSSSISIPPLQPWEKRSNFWSCGCFKLELPYHFCRKNPQENYVSHLGIFCFFLSFMGFVFSRTALIIRLCKLSNRVWTCQKDVDWSNPDPVNGKLLNAIEATGLRQFGLKQKGFVELLLIFTT